MRAGSPPPRAAISAPPPRSTGRSPRPCSSACRSPSSSAALALAVSLAARAAARRAGGAAAGLLDRSATARAFATAGQAMPSFWLALLGILVFSVLLGWLPASGSEQPGRLRDAGAGARLLRDAAGAAAHPLRADRGAARRLHPHRACEGAAAAPRAAQARAAQRGDPRRLGGRGAVRLPARRIGGDRDRVRHERHRLSRLAGGLQRRHPGDRGARAGHRADLRGADRCSPTS